MGFLSKLAFWRRAPVPLPHPGSAVGDVRLLEMLTEYRHTIAAAVANPVSPLTDTARVRQKALMDAVREHEKPLLARPESLDAFIDALEKESRRELTPDRVRKIMQPILEAEHTTLDQLLFPPRPGASIPHTQNGAHVPPAATPHPVTSPPLEPPSPPVVATSPSTGSFSTFSSGFSGGESAAEKALESAAGKSGGKGKWIAGGIVAAAIAVGAFITLSRDKNSAVDETSRRKEGSQPRIT